MRGLSPVAASGGHSSSQCAGLSPSRPLLLWSTGSRCAGSVVVAHGPSCSAACGILPDQGSNPCPLHWQADPQPLCHQGSPVEFFFLISVNCILSSDWFFYFLTAYWCFHCVYPSSQDQWACLWLLLWTLYQGVAYLHFIYLFFWSFVLFLHLEHIPLLSHFA